MKKLIILLIAAASSLIADAGDPTRHEMVYNDTVRRYAVYRPAEVNEYAPLVVYAHGYGSKTRCRNDLNQAAERHGFVVCYPDGAPDSRGKDGWYVGYPSQYNMDKDEASFFKALLDTVCRQQALDRENVFMTGFSNGGDLCYRFAYTDPGLFKAYASVAGLTFEWVCNGFSLTEPVDFIEIHGNADKTSMWDGDHGNTGGWGAYIPVPLAVAAIADSNRCTTSNVDSLPSATGDGRIVTRTVYAGSQSGKTVTLYEVDGGGHSWHDKDIDTGEIILQFFEAVLRRE